MQLQIVFPPAILTINKTPLKPIIALRLILRFGINKLI